MAKIEICMASSDEFSLREEPKEDFVWIVKTLGCYGAYIPESGFLAVSREPFTAQQVNDAWKEWAVEVGFYSPEDQDRWYPEPEDWTVFGGAFNG